MKHSHRRIFTGLGIAATVLILAAFAKSYDVSAAPDNTAKGQQKTDTVKQQDKELVTTTIKLHSYDDMQERLKAIDEYRKFISSKEIDWNVGSEGWSDPSYKVTVPRDVLTYEIVFLGENGFPALFLDNDFYTSHADGYQELIVYNKGKMNVLVNSDKLYFYPKAGIVVSQHFGGGYGEVDRSYWLFDDAKKDVKLMATEYHLTPRANIMDYTQEDIDAMVKNGATAGEYMAVYDPPVKVDKDFDWSSKKNMKELTTRDKIIKAFEQYFNDYGEFETFKKEMEIFEK